MVAPLLGLVLCLWVGATDARSNATTTANTGITCFPEHVNSSQMRVNRVSSIYNEQYLAEYTLQAIASHRRWSSRGTDNEYIEYEFPDAINLTNLHLCGHGNEHSPRTINISTCVLSREPVNGAATSFQCAHLKTIRMSPGDSRRQHFDMLPLPWDAPPDDRFSMDLPERHDSTHRCPATVAVRGIRLDFIDNFGGSTFELSQAAFVKMGVNWSELTEEERFECYTMAVFAGLIVIGFMAFGVCQLQLRVKLKHKHSRVLAISLIKTPLYAFNQWLLVRGCGMKWRRERERESARRRESKLIAEREKEGVSVRKRVTTPTREEVARYMMGGGTCMLLPLISSLPLPTP